MTRIERDRKGGVPALLAVAATLGLLTCQPALAGFNQGNAVTFNGEPMFKIEGAAGGFTSEHRAWQAQDNFDNALASTPFPTADMVAVERQNDAYVLTLAGRYVITADAASARICDMTPEDLAQSWAESMRNCLSDSKQVDAYVASLTCNHQVSAEPIVTEDVVSAKTAGVPFKLAEGVLSIDSKDPSRVVAVLDRPVVLKTCELPAKTVLTGVLKTGAHDTRYVQFSTATAPDGKRIDLSNLTALATYETEAPKPVITEDIPVDSKTETRRPATIGLGAQKTEISVLQARPSMVARAAQGL
ncbi:MAG: hypothetical protein AB7W16_17580 [Candidatus Obscuribacterales bacterium]